MNSPIYVMPTFHHDVAYLQPEHSYQQRAEQILKKALRLMEQDHNYTFTVEQTYFIKEYLKHFPEDLELLRKFVRTGQLTFAPGFWTVPDMCMPGGESLFMQAIMGKRFLKQTLDTDPKVAFIADCWGHHGQLPQIISQCGYQYYMFSRCMEKSFDVENFRWRGLDGTELNCHWMSSAYAGISFPDDAQAVNAEEMHWEQASKEGVMALYAQNREHCGEDAQLIPAGGDMKMPAASGSEIIKKLQKEADMPKISFATPEHALSQIDFSEKSVYSKEFISCFKGSFATNIRIKQYNRKLESELASLETLSVLKQRKTNLLPVWETVLKNQFHDILCGTICDQALLQVCEEYEQALDTMERVREELSVEGSAAYFNPVPFKRMELRDRCLLEAEGWDYAQSRTLQEQPFTLPGVFENEYYKAELDEKGFISALTEKATGTLLAGKTQIPFGSLTLQADSGDNWEEFEYPGLDDTTHYTNNEPDPYDRSNLLKHGGAMLTSNGVTAAAARLLGDDALQITQTGMLKYWVTEVPFTITITLYKYSPRIDYHTEFDCNNRRLRLRVAFPHTVEQGMVRHQIPFGMVERGEGLQPAQYLMDVQNQKAGLSLINRGLPANNTEDGIMMLTLFRSVAMEYKCQSELSYNLGQHIVCDYAVLPHPADQDTLLWQQSIGFQQPMVLTSIENLQRYKVEHAQVSALRYDDEDVFLRIYNGTDKETEARITLPDCVSFYAFTDGLMEAGNKKPVSGTLILPLGPFEIRGIKFYD